MTSIQAPAETVIPNSVAGQIILAESHCDEVHSSRLTGGCIPVKITFAD
jgi:hypothetical protein